MDITELSFGIAIVMQFSIGVSVNVFVFLFYAQIISTSYKASFSDLILAHLAFANTTVLLTRGIPDILSVWGLRNFLDAAGCKVVFYVFRVARGLSICTTCLLSVFQAVTISPGTSWWAGIKTKLPKYIMPSLVIFWILNMLTDLNMLILVTGPQNSGNAHTHQDMKFCSMVNSSAQTSLIFSIVLSLRDLFFVGLMSVASSYMVFVLHRHHRRVRHLHGPGRSPRVMPEVQAAKRVIALVALYIILYGRQTVMLNIILNRKEKSPLLVDSHRVLSFTFSAISPFLMIYNDRRMRTFWKRDSLVSQTGTLLRTQGKAITLNLLSH
ncbi:vomeronasal 1 receptor ornAnaV1R3201 [Ornithorhynchus anatinus]|uniref:vomeronasal 1 receptor ornAnaV1R3201 n=1 Tax=Ornithorhynchus anatinus TaxID=9258 RepID=UPI0003C75BD6|nr:vomeronasal 1 receptor ornAnaV1R3201 [Ornithorhynchus anatinus]